jgi:hypothetical protein
MSGKVFTVIAAALVSSAGACSLLTKLDVPTGDLDGDAGVAATVDSGVDATAPRDATAGDAGADGTAPPEPEASAAGDACAEDAATPYYAATFVDQSFPFATDALVMTQGQIIPSYLEFKNTGTTPWEPSTELGTTNPRNRTSAFADTTWISPSRAAAVKGTVAPGATYRFEFDLQAPMEAGTYYEYFDFVDEGAWHCDSPEIWFGDPGQGGPTDTDIEVQIVVK